MRYSPEYLRTVVAIALRRPEIKLLWAAGSRHFTYWFFWTCEVAAGCGVRQMESAEQRFQTTVYFKGGMTHDQVRLAAAAFKADYIARPFYDSRTYAMFAAMLKELPPSIKEPRSCRRPSRSHSCATSSTTCSRSR